MTSDYRHTQFGGTVLLVLGCAIAVAVFLNETPTRGLPTLMLELILLACLALFYALHVEVDAQALSWRLGIGIVRRRVLLEDIVAVRQVRNRWYQGWGIRKIPGGWLYNVSGLDAVEVETRHGRRWRIGTDEPQSLAWAIRSRLPAEAATHAAERVSGETDQSSER